MVATPLADHQPHYLTTEDVAARYRTAPGTIRYWRHIGYGPKGIKVGRRVLYTQAAIDDFERHLAAENANDGAEDKLPGHLDAAERVTSHQR